ncbi:MAG: hypothetical protein ABIL11_07325 [Chloroflexota bacterium]
MDEIEVVVQAFAAVTHQIGLAGALVMPGPVRRTGFQSRKNVNQPRLSTALLENVSDPIFFAKVLLANVLDLQAIGLGYRFCMRTHLFMQRLCELGIVKNANALSIQIPAHTLGITQEL